ncbi:MAG TPA: porin family protein [bacterium]|nr:porin family protein [bacterium]
MKRVLIASFFSAILFAVQAPLFAQSTVDVVTFKNGAVIQGQVLEQWPGVSLKVRMDNGTVQVYRMSDVSKITKLDRPPQNLTPPPEAPGLPSASAPAASPADQGPSRGGQVGFGLLAGVDMANELYYGSSLDNRVGFIGGCFVDFGLSNRISIQPEVLFAMKGGNSGPYYSDQINYVEMPILFKLSFPSDKDLRFDLFSGPYLAVLASGFSGYDGIVYGDSSSFTQADAGWVFGGGLEIDRFLLDLRYEIGFVPNDQQEYGPVNTSMALMAGYRLFN